MYPSVAPETRGIVMDESRVLLWDSLCEHASIHRLKKTTLVRALCGRCGGLLSLGCVGHPQRSLLTSLFPSSGHSSKKPTREWEPLSEPKVMPACLPAPSASPLLGPGGGHLQSTRRASSTRRMCLRPELLCLAPRGLWVYSEGASRGLVPWRVMHVGWAVCGAWRSTRNALWAHPGLQKAAYHAPRQWH